jgi:acid-activated urea channel
MLGLILLYVGAVLISNGVARICNIQGPAVAVMNLFTGGLGLVLNVVSVGIGIAHDADPSWYYASATGLLFAFTYLYVALNAIFKLDGRLYGWYSLFVAVNAVPAGVLCFYGYGGNAWYGVIWFLWGALWLTGFLENCCGVRLGRFVGYLGVFEGVATAWLPGFLMLTGVWPA